MNRKKELKQLYKETKITAGIYKIENTSTGKLFVGSTNNLKTLNGVVFMLENGSHMNRQLQEDWKALGKDAFKIEVLEELKESQEALTNPKKELANLEEKWLENLHPYGAKGYNV